MFVYTFFSLSLTISLSLNARFALNARFLVHSISVCGIKCVLKTLFRGVGAGLGIEKRLGEGGGWVCLKTRACACIGAAATA